MKDYTKILPEHIEKYIGENDLFLEVYNGADDIPISEKKPPLLFVHGAYTGSWMWSKYIPHFAEEGWKCYVMNLRGHYKSRAMDLTRVSFEDYLEDIKEIIAECGEPPVMIGFSMGGILCQKIAEMEAASGMVSMDSSICRQVYEKVPFKKPAGNIPENIVPAPDRNESSSIDESAGDIEFQRKYLAMESAKALSACSISFGGTEGISIDNGVVTCPCLVIRTSNNMEEEKRVRAEAEYFHAEYTGMKEATHTGLLIGQRYKEGVDSILKWLERF
ncbi:alpha/beta hydrolase family protein [Anaerocolumna xylanovorans]|uniref:Lysophospholipase, alpha-beta hydrolase superfamily n=1 Tax=Anaerocolumna xylanovorans DSM 12503 TaxID=1121345 RepID=A0A1M7XZB2_9FIRM|nr:alpha/beta hydrolase family protein [Anaerocolumna xylanovorans]SHO44271.1 Lysophospholipase, alpha-beta hydrolase superfamily [Anaerocolumna xylanovorans DSM 12503]